MANSDYQELSDLLGKPLERDTGFSLGGPMANTLFDLKKFKETDYVMGGPLRNLLINPGGREIARLSGPLRSWFFIGGKHTGYFLCGASGRRIFYDPGRDEFLR